MYTKHYIVLGMSKAQYLVKCLNILKYYNVEIHILLRKPACILLTVEGQI